MSKEGIEGMVEVEKQAADFMANPPEQREKLLYIAILKTDRRVAKIEKDGCAKACAPSIVDRWTPATVGTVVMGVLVGLLEYLRSGKGGH